MKQIIPYFLWYLVLQFIFINKFYSGNFNYHKYINADSSLLIKKKNTSIAKAVVLSAIIPGAGQVYNKKIWKVPLIYGAFAGAGYVFYKNNTNYKQYKNALTYRYDDDPSTKDDFLIYTDDNLVALKNQFKRRRDIGIIGIAAVYLFNVIDAAVDAQLKDFDVKINEDISLKVSPYTFYSSTNFKQFNVGVQLKLNFN